MKDGIIVRPYLPVGLYSSAHFAHRDARMVIRDDVIYSAVRFRPVELDDYVLEREWVTTVEVRLLAALVLAVPELGRITPYPYPRFLRVDDRGEDLSDDAVAESLGGMLVEWMEDQDYDFWLTVDRPPIHGGPPYRFHSNAGDTEKQMEVFEAILPDDHLMLRGLGAILKAGLLDRHHLFHTEACMSLYVAMEASLHIILQHLGQSMPNPSNEDASRFVAEIFESRHVPKKYFEGFYENRVMAVHPNSRYGAFPEVPLMADDYYELDRQMRGLYDFFLTGTIHESMRG